MIEKKKTKCTYCSLGCGIKIRVKGSTVTEPDYDLDDPINHGSICPRGNYAYEIIKSPERISDPYLVQNGQAQKCGWEEAVNYIATNLNTLKNKYSGDSLGVIASPLFSNQDLNAAAKFAKNVLGTSNFEVLGVAASNGTVEDKLATVEDIEKQQLLLIVGDALTRSPVISKMVNKVKHADRNNKIITLDFRKTHTSWFANQHLEVKPGTEALAIAGILKLIADRKKKNILSGLSMEDIANSTGISIGSIKSVADAFDSAEKAMIIIATTLDDELVLSLSSLLADTAHGEKKYLPFYASGNYLGAQKVINNHKASTVIDKLLSKKIKALVVFGEDILRAIPKKSMHDVLANLDFLLVVNCFAGMTVKYASALLPAASVYESEASVNLSGKREESLAPVVLPTNESKPITEIIELLNNKLAAGKPMQLIDVSQSSQKPDIDALVNSLKKIKAPVSNDEEYVLVPFNDISHVGDGSYSSNFTWAKRKAKGAYVEINSADAGKIGVKTGDKLNIKSSAGEAAAVVRISDSVPSRIISTSHHFPEIRKLFSDNLNFKYEIVSIGK